MREVSTMEKSLTTKLELLNNNLQEVKVSIQHQPPTLAPEPPTPMEQKSQDAPSMAPQPTSGPGTHSLTPIDLTTILNHTSQIKPVFPSYKPEVMTVTKWQFMCMLKLSSCTNPYYSSFVTIDENGSNIMDPNMSVEKRASLFSLIQDALPHAKLNLEFITESMIQNANGLTLWKTCGLRFAAKKKGHYEKEELKAEFKSLNKNDNESNASFLKRIEQKANELALHDINLKAHEKALTLLKGLKSEYLRNPIVAIMQDDGNGKYKDWIVEDDLMHTLNKAESRIKYEQAAAALLNPKKTPVLNPYKPVPNPYKAAVLAGRAPGSTPAAPKLSKSSPVLTAKQQLIQEMKACPDQQKRINKLFQWKAKEKDGCILHPNLKLHKFLRCDDVCDLCAVNGWTEDLVETKLRNQMFAKKKLQEENATSSSSTTTSRDTIKQIEKEVAARKAAMEAEQAQSPINGPPEDEDEEDNRSQETRSTIATDE